jgi:hypothetical protein
MTHVERLREQARALRTVAASFDIADIQEQLIKLAERCEALAAASEEAVSEDREPPAEA